MEPQTGVSGLASAVGDGRANRNASAARGNNPAAAPAQRRGCREKRWMIRRLNMGKPSLALFVGARLREKAKRHLGAPRVPTALTGLASRAGTADFGLSRP